MINRCNCSVEDRISIFILMFKWGFVILFLFVSISAISQDFRRFTIWNKNAIEVAPWNKVSLSVAQKIHYTPESSTVDLKFGELFLGHEPLNWLEYGAGFRHSAANLRNGNWLKENRSMFFFNLSKEIKEFELSFSNRLEYRDYKELESHFRHKQSLTLDFPKLVEWGMQFYLSEESFYKMNGAGTHLARFQSGIKALDKEHFDVKVYYILEKAEVFETWITGDIVGLNLSFSI